MTQLTENVFAVEAPEGVEGCEIRGEHPGRPYQLLSFYGEADAIDLPPGNWRILCMTRTGTPNQAREITGELLYPSIALAGMLKGKGLDVNKNYCLLKKVEQ